MCARAYVRAVSVFFFGAWAARPFRRPSSPRHPVPTPATAGTHSRSDTSHSGMTGALRRHCAAKRTSSSAPVGVVGAGVRGRLPVPGVPRGAPDGGAGPVRHVGARRHFLVRCHVRRPRGFVGGLLDRAPVQPRVPPRPASRPLSRRRGSSGTRADLAASLAHVRSSPLSRSAMRIYNVRQRPEVQAPTLVWPPAEECKLRWCMAWPEFHSTIRQPGVRAGEDGMGWEGVDSPNNTKVREAQPRLQTNITSDVVR